MTQDEIIEMARQVGLCRTQSNFNDWIDAGPSGYELEAFAKLVAAKEREACAKVCEEISTEARKLWKARYEPHDDGRSDGAYECAEAIRARGEA